MKQLLTKTRLFKRSCLNKSFIFSILFFSILNLNAQLYPVTVTVNLNPPYSVFLYDYIEQGSNLLNSTVIFNDLNEVDRDVFFKIRIESSDIAIYSKPDYISTEPFNVLSGAIYEFSGEDFEECLNYNNLMFSGISQSEFIQNGGRLPSNFYTISLEVYDFKSGKRISNTAQTAAQIRLNSPPVIILPENGSVVQISENQNVTVQWQPTVIYGNGSLSETEYSLLVYKIYDSCTDPDRAVVNKQVNQIFESDYLQDITFLYNIIHPELEIGKRYAILIHARDIYDRDIFENNGYSEQSWFYYGYPEGGQITIEYPEDGKNFSIQDMPHFKWESPNNTLPGQSVFYEFKIVETDSLPPEQAIIINEPFYSKTTNPTIYNNGGQVNMPIFLERQKQYAWQVKAYTGEQEIAESEVYVCYGPPLLEMFWAEHHKVYVTKTTTSDYAHLSGEGRMKISADGEMADIAFNDIKIENNGEWIITEGEIFHKLNNAPPVTLDPYNLDNGETYLIVDSLRLAKNIYTYKYELRVKGFIEWEFPHAIDSVHQGVIRSKSTWFNYNDYHAYGKAFLTNNCKFNLLEPYNHKFELSPSSYFLIYENKYTPGLEGNILLPENIKDTQGNRVALPFSNADNLYYFTSPQIEINNNILLIENTEIEFDPTDVIFDFSEIMSPQRFSGNNEWKGVYFEKFNIIYKINIDGTGQIKLSEQKTYPYNLNSNPDIKAWTTGEGLDFYIDNDLQNNGSFFNTFPSELLEIKLDIENSFLNEGYIMGSILIPVISETENYTYTVPITNEGFNVGYLDNDFTNFSYTLNPEGGEQQVDILIKTISFIENTRLEMTIDVGWPSIDVTMEALDGFCIWGNYSIGFYNPNSGRNLVTNVDGILEQYEVTIESVGCGSSEGAYGFGTSGVVVIGDDICGENGPPKINLYSVYPSIYAPFVDEGDFEFDSIAIAEIIDNLNQEIAELEQLQENIEDLANAGGVVSGDVNSVIDNTNTTPSDNTYTEEDFEYEETPEEPENEEFSVEKLIQIIEGFSIFLPEEEQIKLQEVVNFIEVIPLEELIKIYDELKDIKSLSKKLAKAFVQNKINELNAKINQAFDRVTNNINAKIDSSLLAVNDFTDGVIDDVFNAIELRVIQLTQNNKFDVEPIVHSVVLVSKNALKNEINEALFTSVSQNIKIPITSFIQHQIRDSITNFISVEIGGIAYQLIDDGELDLNINFDELLLGIGNSIIDAIDAEKIFNTILNTGKDFIANITFESYIQNVLQEAMDQLLSANTALSVALNNLIEDNVLLQNLTANVSFDFDNIGEKLANGEIDQIIKFDLTRIKINTKTLELEGFAEFKKDDPVWGNSFHLDVVAKIKLSEDNQMGAFVGFISGKTTAEAENFSYWYVAAGVSDILVPLTPTPFNMTGIEGCLYRRMSLQGPDYLPDVNTNFGIDVNMYLNDISTQGQIIQLVVGTQFIFFDDGFEIQINGDIKAGNKDAFSLITGGGYLNFNSRTGHLIGQFNVMANTAPVICAQGEMGVEIKGADDWNVYVGKRVSPVFIRLLCKETLSIESWFDISNTQLDLGLRANFQLEARSQWFNIPLSSREWSVFAGVGFGFEASTIIWWDPFGINDALIEVSVWAELGADWRKDNGDTGTWTLVSVSLYGMLNFATVPEAWITGELSGHVTICNIGISFDAEMNHQFS